MEMSTGDKELAARAAQGDATAFELLLERHYDTMFRFAYRYFGIREEAEDVAQAVCMSLVDRIGSFDGQSQFSSWLFRVVRNACHDARRRNKTRMENEQAFLSVQQLRQDANEEAVADSVWLYQALDHVGEELRETAMLVLGEELTHAQAGELLGVTENTISWRMHELRKRLKAFAEAEQ